MIETIPQEGPKSRPAIPKWKQQTIKSIVFCYISPKTIRMTVQDTRWEHGLESPRPQKARQGSQMEPGQARSSQFGAKLEPTGLPGGSGKVPGHSQDHFFDDFLLIFEAVFSTKSSSDIYDFIKFVNGLTKEISWQLHAFVRLWLGRPRNTW